MRSASVFVSTPLRISLLATLSVAGGTASALFAQGPLAGDMAANTVEMASLEVTGTAARLIDATTLKLPTTAHETPRSVSVIDAGRIEEQNFRTPVDTFFYTPGVFANSTASGGYHFIARGFRMSPDETRVDGFSGFYVGGGQSPQSLYGVDRIVSLRGPSSLLYGASTLPGGMLNIITKKPEATCATRVFTTASTFAGNSVDFGDRASLGFELDHTGPLTSNDRILYRAIIAGDDSETYTGGINNQTRYYNGSVTFVLDEETRTTLTPLVQFADYDRPAGAAMVISPSTSLATNDGLTGPINENDLSPLDVNLFGGGRSDSMFVAGFDFRSQPVTFATLNAAYRYIAYRTDINQWSPVVTTAAQRTTLATTGVVSRTQAKSWADRDSHNFDVNGTYEAPSTPAFKNLVQAGLNGRFYRSRSRSATGPLTTPQSPLNIYTGVATTALTDVSTGWGAQAFDDDFYWNTYLQDQMSILEDRWIVTLGLGYGQQEYNDAATRKGDVTPNASVVFNATKQLAVYASYATSYSPADPTQQNYAGATNTFDPQTGVNYEIGAKYDLPARRASVAVALFHTERDNVIVQDTSLGTVNPNGFAYYTQQGGQSARGVELSSEFTPLPNWRLNATFAYIDASYETGLYPTPVAKTPEYSWSLFTRYDFTAGALKNLGASLGLVWQDDRLGGNGARSATSPDPLTLPDFLRVDAGLFYRLKAVDLSLNVENLLDEKIFIDGTTGANLQIAAPRTLTARVSYRF